VPLGFRPDAHLVKGVPATRRIMPFLMPTRNESAVYFPLELDARALNAYVEEVRAHTGLKVTVLHVLLACFARVLDERPRLNRFTAGGRLWQRRGIWASFSAKKEKSDKGAIVVVKRQLDPKASLAELVRVIDGDVKEARSDKKSRTDKELSLLLALPVFALALFVRMAKLLDHYGLLPGWFIEGDPLFSSVFVANLGSLGMDPAFHHMYEYGSIPIFVVVGQQVTQLRRDETGAIVDVPVLPLRFTFDERIEDGLYCLNALKRLEEMLKDPKAALATPTA
jgi:hypothetical protein